MKSNDNIPRDEMLLAEALAAAKARGLGWCNGSLFRTKWAVGLNGKRGVPKSAAYCCAYGALIVAGVAPLRFAERDNDLEDVGYGNDYNDIWSTDVDRGESLGWAFRCAMTQEDS